MNGRLHQRVALVTAAGQGIGRATARAFAREGAIVWATDIDETLLGELSAEHANIRARFLDVRSAEGIDEIASEIGTIDVLFNCAGYVHQGTILECSDEDWDFAFDLNVKSMYRTCRAFLPAMLRAQRGNIINVSSTVSSVKGVPRRFAYCASEAAVVGFTKAIAADFIGQGIRCNAICPGTVDSPSLHKRIAAHQDPERALADFVARQPMGRLGRPEEIAALALYLASDESGFTTGQTHVIDGGLTL
jgi:2-keto-3-deoxy-L-fuconate dehydrogenase